jgi:DNA-binding GntR family transcriptional regulator
MNREQTAEISGDIHPSLEAETARSLKSAIMSGEFAPGSRLIELDLATRFNVSQGTIRAALKHLHAEGLVEHRPRRGNFVISVDETDVFEISVLRDALESLGARLAAKRINDSGRKSLARIMQAMRKAASSGNRSKLTDLDLEFHRTIIEISGHRRLMEVYKRLESQTRLFLQMTDHLYPNAEDILALHEPLAAAISSGDADSAFQLANRHTDTDADGILREMENSRRNVTAAAR